MTDLEELKHRIRTQCRAKLHHAVIAASMQQHGIVVFQGASRPATVISNIVFDFDIVFAAITATFLTVVDQSNTCMQIARPVWFNCSCQYMTALCNTWPLSNSQGKVATLIR